MNNGLALVIEFHEASIIITRVGIEDRMVEPSCVVLRLVWDILQCKG